MNRREFIRNVGAIVAAMTIPFGKVLKVIANEDWVTMAITWNDATDELKAYRNGESIVLVDNNLHDIYSARLEDNFDGFVGTLLVWPAEVATLKTWELRVDT